MWPRLAERKETRPSDQYTVLSLVQPGRPPGSILVFVSPATCATGFQITQPFPRLVTAHESLTARASPSCATLLADSPQMPFARRRTGPQAALTLLASLSPPQAQPSNLIAASALCGQTSVACCGQVGAHHCALGKSASQSVTVFVTPVWWQPLRLWRHTCRARMQSLLGPGLPPAPRSCLCCRRYGVSGVQMTSRQALGICMSMRASSERYRRGYSAIGTPRCGVLWV